MLPNHFSTVGKGRSLYKTKANITIGADKRIHRQEIQKPCSAFLLQLSLAKKYQSLTVYCKVASSCHSHKEMRKTRQGIKGYIVTAS